jgi:transcriptional regulator
VSDAPADFVDKLIGAIVGLEFSIERIEAKRKLSQHRPLEERQSVVDALRRRGEGFDLAIAAAMAGLPDTA